MKKPVLCCLLLLAMVGCSKKSKKWELVIHARGGQIENTRLVLDDADQYAIAFTEAEPRKAVSVPLKDIVSLWDTIFSKNAPNAILSIRTVKNEQKEQEVILKKPRLSDNRLTFTIAQRGDRFEGQFTDAVLFVDASTFVCTHWKVTGSYKSRTCSLFKYPTYGIGP